MMTFITRLLRMRARVLKLPVALLFFALVQPALANVIEFDGLQVWDNQPDGMGTWDVDGSTLGFHPFFVNTAGVYDFSVTPGPYLAPNGIVYDTYLRVYKDAVLEFHGVAGGYLPNSFALDTGYHIAVFSYGWYEGDDATESGYNYLSIHDSPAPFEDIPYKLTISGPSVSVPEPATVLLTLAGLLGVALGRGRMRK